MKENGPCLLWGHIYCVVSGYEIFVVKRNCASDFPENVVIIFSTVGTFEKEKKKYCLRGRGQTEIDQSNRR